MSVKFKVFHLDIMRRGWPVWTWPRKWGFVQPSAKFRWLRGHYEVDLGWWSVWFSILCDVYSFEDDICWGRKGRMI